MITGVSSGSCWQFINGDHTVKHALSGRPSIAHGDGRLISINHERSHELLCVVAATSCCVNDKKVPH